jgi:hypothetical protein
MNRLFEEFKGLKKIFDGKFIITKEVKEEIIDHPLNMKRFELEALKIKELLDTKVLEMPSSLGINESEISKESQKILDLANNTFSKMGKGVHIIESGESSCLALSKILTTKGIENIIAVDERTTRVFSEKPENLRKLLQEKLHTKIETNEKNYPYFKGFKFIRSIELVYVAYKKNLIKLKDPNLLDALLYAMKFKGASVSEAEIKEIKRIG